MALSADQKDDLKSVLFRSDFTLKGNARLEDRGAFQRLMGAIGIGRDTFSNAIAYMSSGSTLMGISGTTIGVLGYGITELALAMENGLNPIIANAGAGAIAVGCFAGAIAATIHTFENWDKFQKFGEKIFGEEHFSAISKEDIREVYPDLPEEHLREVFKYFPEKHPDADVRAKEGSQYGTVNYTDFRWEPCMPYGRMEPDMSVLSNIDQFRDRVAQEVKEEGPGQGSKGPTNR